MGWSLLSFVALNVGVNFIAMFYVIVITIKTFLKRYFARKKQEKLFKKKVAELEKEWREHKQIANTFERHNTMM